MGGGANEGLPDLDFLVLFCPFLSFLDFLFFFFSGTFQIGPSPLSRPLDFIKSTYEEQSVTQSGPSPKKRETPRLGNPPVYLLPMTQRLLDKLGERMFVLIFCPRSPRVESPQPRIKSSAR